MKTSISSHNYKVVLSAQFLSALAFTIPVWIPYYLGVLDITQVSFLISFQYVIQLVLELPTGALADLIGRKKTVFLGYITLALSSLLIVTGPNFNLIFIAAVAAGISEALISGSLEALLYDSYKQDDKENLYQKGMASMGFWIQIGLAGGAFFGGFLYGVWHGLPFLLYGIVSIAAAAISLFMIEPDIDSMKFTLRNYVRQIRNGAYHAFHKKQVAIVSLFYILVAGITWSSQTYFNSFMLVDLGFSDTTRGIIGASQRLLNVFILRNLLKNDHIFTRQRSIFFFPVLMIVAYIPGIFLQGWWGVPFITLALMASTARWLVLTKYTNEVFESKYRATAISTLSMIIGIIYIIITFVSGPVMQYLGGARTMYTILGIVTLVTVLPLSFVVVKIKANTLRN